MNNGMRAVKISIGFLFAIFMVLTVSKSWTHAIRPAGNVVILFTHDLHSHFFPYPVLESDGKLTTVGGYARLATAIKQERARYGGKTLLVDAGDFAEGTLFHTVLPDKALEFRLMGILGYDAITLGNHDFGFNPDGLAKMMRTVKARGGSYPEVVASNTEFSQDGAGDAELKKAFHEFPVQEYVVVERGGMKIGLFGLMGKDAAEDAPYAKPVTFVDPVEASKRIVNILRENEKVDMIICLSHSGTRPQKSTSEDEILAEKVPDIDVIISGHTHTTLSRPLIIGKTIIVSSGSYGAYLGVLNMTFTKEKGAAVKAYDLVKMTPDVLEDLAVAHQIKSFKKIVERHYLSHFNYRFDQVLAQTGFDMEQLAYMYANPGEKGIGNLITDAFRHAVKKAEGPYYRHVHAALQGLGTIRSSFVQGKIFVPDVFRVLSMGPGEYGLPGNTLISGYLTGKDLKNFLEVHTSIAPYKEDAYLQVSGIAFEYNPYRVIFDRVISVKVLDEDGEYKLLDPGRLYRVVINSFTAELLSKIGEKSHGILSVQLRDETGSAVKDIKTLMIRAKGQSGIGGVKEWVALADYLTSFPDADGDGIPDVPARYRGSEGRIVTKASWNPLDLVTGGGWITWGVLFLCLVFLTVVIFTVRAIINKVCRPRNPGNRGT
jgi:5'-nucleotidase/UDP-sugar diphosphatase